MSNKNIDPESRDYSFKDIEDDPRLKRTTKEFFITFFSFIIYSALMIINLFTFGLHSKDYPKVFGFPLWIFILICIIVLFVTSIELICTFVYKDMDLTSKAKKQEENK